MHTSAALHTVPCVLPRWLCHGRRVNPPAIECPSGVHWPVLSGVCTAHLKGFSWPDASFLLAPNCPKMLSKGLLLLSRAPAASVALVAPVASAVVSLSPKTSSPCGATRYRIRCGKPILLSMHAGIGQQQVCTTAPEEQPTPPVGLGPATAWPHLSLDVCLPHTTHTTHTNRVVLIDASSQQDEARDIHLGQHSYGLRPTPTWGMGMGSYRSGSNLGRQGGRMATQHGNAV